MSDLAQYLPDDMAYFLKQDAMVSSSAMLVNNSSGLENDESIDKEGINIEESKSLLV